MGSLRLAKVWKLRGYTLHRYRQNRYLSTSPQKSIPKRVNYEGPIVISGISARLPKSRTMEEFKLNLFNGVDMTTDEKRWNDDKLPDRNGYLNCLDKFDASFFNQTPRQAEQIDAQARLLLETSFEAILDAGRLWFLVAIISLPCDTLTAYTLADS